MAFNLVRSATGSVAIVVAAGIYDLCQFYLLLVRTTHTEGEALAAREVLEKEGSGPAAARVEIARRIRKGRMMMLDKAERMW